jgi:hypothetical protein
MDLDVRVPEDDDNYRRLIAVLEGRGMIARIPEPMLSLCDQERRHSWVQDKGALVWTAQSPDGIEQIDVFLSYPVPWSDLVRDAKTVTVSGRSVRISSREHLILAKRQVDPPRRKDLRDIEDLEALP